VESERAVTSQPHSSDRGRLDVLIVGAGFAGLHALYNMRQLGLSALVVEAGDGVGGTWYWNRYPGARCDVESLEYSFSFDPELEQEWEWTERYPAQPEIRRYLDHVADRFDLRPDIRLGSRVTELAYGEATHSWTSRSDDGFTAEATYCVLASGMLTVPNTPGIPGIETFAGDTFHTARWPEAGVDLHGRRVGVIGTGSTGIQFTTTAARDVDHLTVFQRTPNFSLPAFNGPADPERTRQIKAHYGERRRLARMSPAGTTMSFNAKLSTDMTPEELEHEFETRWQEGGFAMLGAMADLVVSQAANDLAADFVCRKIASIVEDPTTARALMPSGYPIGTKRICVDTGYYETYNRDNVTLVDLRETPLQEITPTGLRTSDADYAFDTLVLATGFDAMTGALMKISITGVGGQTIQDAWADGPQTYLGLTTAGFPNLFIITGPGSPSVLSNMVISIEQHVEWITECLRWMGERGYDRIEPTADAQQEWTEHVATVASATLHGSTNNWYNGANIPGKTRIFMPYVGGVGPYREHCDGVAAREYEGFAFQSAENLATVR
jgi:cation diffusion facilitator CzcD-associated flavoprotein CzcO